MIPDRITLLIACAIAAAPLLQLSPSVQQALGVVYSVHALRAYRRDLAAQRQHRARRTADDLIRRRSE
jgi:hypothetical protein